MGKTALCPNCGKENGYAIGERPWDDTTEYCCPDCRQMWLGEPETASTRRRKDAPIPRQRRGGCR